MRADVHERLHSGANDLRRGRPRDVHAGKQRLLGLRFGRRMRNPPDLHWNGRLGGLRVQQRPGVQLRGKRMRQPFDLGNLREGRAGMLLPVDGTDGVHQRRLQRRRLLHQRVHERDQRVSSN